MRCECCNNLLSDVDATARFAESGNFVGMCGPCRKHLPKDIQVITRSDLERTEREEEDADVAWEDEYEDIWKDNDD